MNGRAKWIRVTVSAVECAKNHPMTEERNADA